jgi:fido (protein-threonine AMPylation protein)
MPSVNKYAVAVSENSAEITALLLNDARTRRQTTYINEEHLSSIHIYLF